MADRPSDSARALARSMAAATGLDLTQAQRTGILNADEVSDLFQSCGRCTSWQDCPSWMEEHGTVPAKAPGYCRNRAFFEEVRRRQVDRSTT